MSASFCFLVLKKKKKTKIPTNVLFCLKARHACADCNRLIQIVRAAPWSIWRVIWGILVSSVVLFCFSSTLLSFWGVYGVVS